MFYLPVHSYSQFELGKVKRNLSWDDTDAKEILAHPVPGKREDYQIVFKI